MNKYDVLLLPEAEARIFRAPERPRLSRTGVLVGGLDPAMGGVSAACVGELLDGGELVVRASKEWTGGTLSEAAEWFAERAGEREIAVGLDPTCSRPNWQTGWSDIEVLEGLGLGTMLIRVPVHSRLGVLQMTMRNIPGVVGLWIEEGAAEAALAARLHRQRVQSWCACRPMSKRHLHMVDAMSYMAVTACRIWQSMDCDSRRKVRWLP